MYKPHKGNATRVEFRSIDAACNPYLAYALILAAGLKGIEDDYASAAGDDDVWALTSSERRAMGIKPLPHDLGEAINVMQESELVAETLGEHVFDFFLRNKREEWNEYRRQVTEYELDRYLPVLLPGDGPVRPAARSGAPPDQETSRERIVRVEQVVPDAGLAVLAGSHVEPTKLVVLLAGTGAHGHAVETDLTAAGMPVEMADRDTVVPVITLADDPGHVARFTRGLAAVIERHRSAPRPPAATLTWSLARATVLPPRDAFFAPHETVPAGAAAGRVSAELVAPYPPGIPVLAPGEMITGETIAALRAVRDDGGRVAYAADPTPATLQVVAV